MQDFDVTLKLLLQESADEMLRQLGMGKVKRWLNVELPKVQNLRADLLAWMESGELLHIEVQSSNSNTIQIRMAEYAIGITRLVGTYPRQLLLFVGNERLRMKPEFKAPGMDFHYHQVDIRDLDSAALLASDRISDNMLAIFAGLGNAREGIRQILQKIVAMPREQRDSLLPKVLLTCGLRGLKPIAQEELERMAITLEDLMQDSLIGPGIREYVQKRYEEEIEKKRAEALAKGVTEGLAKGRTEGLAKGITEGLAKGITEGRAKGITEGRVEGFRGLTRTLLTKRFGPLPSWVDARIESLSAEQASDIATAAMDATSLSQLFGEPPLQ
jgi:hypothetical protein